MFVQDKRKTKGFPVDLTPSTATGGYPIRVVARLTGIPVDTLRAWERRYQAVEPVRDERGRLYGDSDIRRLKLLRRLVERGHAIGRVARLEEAELGAMAEAALDVGDRNRRADVVDVRVLLDALDAYDLAALERRLGKFAAVLSTRELVHEVVLPFMHQVGEGWQVGRFRVAQEHLAAVAMRDLLGGMVRTHAPRDGRPGIVFATPPGERHELGLNAAAMLAAAGGIPVICLGADLPPDDVVEAARRTGAQAVVLAITMGEGIARTLDAVCHISSSLPEGVPTFAGGAAAESHPDDLRSAGAILVRNFDALEQAYRSLGARY